jgi:hypothetical protein
MSRLLDREEYIEQAYFFRTLRERQSANLAVQDILANIDEEILATTRLPYAIQFLSMELKHSGLMASGFARLPHYFTPFQSFVIKQAEEEGFRFNMQTALLVLERQAQYLAGEPTPAGLFFYQFEVLSRNRIGYNEGLTAMAQDPMYDPDWSAFVEMTRRQGGEFDFAEVIYLRSELYAQEQRRNRPDSQLPLPPLFGEKEGRIAKANRRRDPLYLFAALQRQLGYPEVPRSRPPDDLATRFEALLVKLREWETRLKLLEAEVRGNVDLTQFGKPELFKDEE